MTYLSHLFYLIALLAVSTGSNITSAVFSNVVNIMPAAFGDFNSDALTDVFVLRDDGQTIDIMLAAEQEPLLRQAQNLSCQFKNKITSVVPGDFDGDVFMDVLITTFNKSEALTEAYILWGEGGTLNCSYGTNPMIRMKGQPLAIDYNQDMIIDLFGLDENCKRTFWVFSNKTAPRIIHMNKQDKQLNLTQKCDIRRPHSNAFLDLNNDYYPDLFITNNMYFEIWYGNEHGFEYHHKIDFPKSYSKNLPKIGQSLHLDVELTGKVDLILPVCWSNDCSNSTIMIYLKNTWYNLPINFRDPNNVQWGFIRTDGRAYTDTITLHGGDFNMDGYPDLLATLESTTQRRSFLLENVPCENCKNFSRTFEVRWNALIPFTNNSVMAVFYDFYQDGIMDVMLMEVDSNMKNYHVAAFKNSLDYDANFVKVMVLTGRSNSQYPISPGTLGKKKRTYGTNLPGPSISYKTTTQDGSPRKAIAAQLPQSAHFSLNLPFTTFGLGRTPNFIDSLCIGIGNKSREYPQIIPNSQMVIIPNPIDDPSRWKAQLFVTPSKLIALSAIALTATCILIMLIILGLYWKERREDKIEKLQEAHRFHFDAM